MKKILAIALVMILLVGCGSSTPPATNSENEVTESTTAETAADVKVDMAGTYIGLHGSGITFFENGGAEYYWKEWTSVETGDTWEFTDNKIIFHSRSLGYDIYADIDGNNSASLNFKGVGDTTWDDELFVKISDDTNSKNLDEYVALIEKQLNISLADTSQGNDWMENPNLQLIHAGGFVYGLPSSYKMYESNDLMYYTDTHASISFTYGENDRLSKDDISNFIDYPDYVYEEYNKKCRKWLEDFVKSEKEALECTSDEIKDQPNLVPAGCIGCSNYCTLTFDDGVEMVACTSWMVDSSTGAYQECLFVAENKEDVEDYMEIIKWAKAEGNDSNTSLSSDSNKSDDKNASAGVDQDLKEYLDSYEEFINEYAEFLEIYAENRNDGKLLAQYTTMVVKAAEYEDKISKYDTSTFSEEDLIYFNQVTSRCNEKMLKALSKFD